MAEKLRTITVFCGSSVGNDPRFEEAAKALGKCMAERGIDLIYGGGNIGLMGALAKSVKDHGGNVSGFLPGFFLKDSRFDEFSSDETDHGTTTIVTDMHTRKQIMLEKADALIALPGGVGTMEELVEMITWKSLKLHGKPMGILNIAGFYDRFFDWVSHAAKNGFIGNVNDLGHPKEIDHVSDNPGELIDKLTECFKNSIK